jgi:hypothetical protein
VPITTWITSIRYYGLTDLCPAYIVAVALDPTMKITWFRDEWHDKPDWIEQAERTVDDIWRTSYRGESGAVFAEEDGADQNDSKLPRWRRKRRQRRQRRAADDLARDSMEAFQHEPPVDEHAVQDVIKYWAAKRTEPRWKDLARMALEYLTTLYQLCLLFLLFALHLLADHLLLVFGLALQSR